MKKIYIECNMGVAGDMLCGALLDCLNDNEKDIIINKLNTLYKSIEVSCEKVKKCEISATKFNVNIEKENHSHTSINEIYDIIDGFEIKDNIKTDAKEIYKIIARAESKVHNTNVADIHLHEVGAKDAIADIVSCCYLIDFLKIKEITASPIVTGYGEVKAAHGILPVPAPATAEILKGIPNEKGNIKSELTTPTGAGLIKYFAKEITNNYPMTYSKIGYGAGNKDFEKPNCVRVFLSDDNKSTVYELKCQIDDMTGEEMGYALEKLLSYGAKDVYFTPITMKKSRPAYMLTVISSEKDKEYLTKQIFKHTSTLGIRQVKCTRAELDREIVECNGITIKRSQGYGITKEKAEFDELAKIADENDISVFDARKLIK